MKHRKDWMAWKKKREEKLRDQREMNKIIVKMLTEQIDAMHKSSGLIARLMQSKPMPYFGGEKMRSVIIYQQKEGNNGPAH